MRNYTENGGLGERSPNWMVISHNLSILLALLMLANGMFPQYRHRRLENSSLRNCSAQRKRPKVLTLEVAYQTARVQPAVDKAHFCTQDFQKFVYLFIYLFIFKQMQMSKDHQMHVKPSKIKTAKAANRKESKRVQNHSGSRRNLKTSGIKLKLIL